MNPRLPALLAAAALGAAAVFVVRLGAASAPQDAAPPERPPVLLALTDRTPYWNTLVLEDEVPAMLMRVPAGQRFVLTDLWLLSHELLPVGTSETDRLWLECVTGNERRVVFDSPLAELSLPLRWQTGVSFTAGQEMWIRYAFANETKRPRRIHYTGYHEPLEPALFEARPAR